MNPPQLAGRWACLQLTASQARVMKLGGLTTTTRLASVLEIEQDGTALSVHWTILDMRIDSGARLVRVQVPDAMVKAIDPLTRPAQLSHEQGWQLEMPPAWSVVGANLDDPSDDPLPRKANDPRVGDPDGDGAPGVTVRFAGMVAGEAYVVQRSWSHLRSTRLSDDVVAGRVWWGIEQQVLGASNQLLRLAPDTHALDDPARSFFVMQRVSARQSRQAVIDLALGLEATRRTP